MKLIIPLIVLIFMVGCSKPIPDITAQGIEQFTTEGQPTGSAFLVIESDATTAIIAAIDMNQDDTFSAEERIIQGMKSSKGITRFAFELSTPIKSDIVKARINGIDQSIQITNSEVSEFVDLTADGASVELKRQGTAGENFDVVRESDVPDLSAGKMDCFAVSATNNVLSLAEENGMRDKLPQNPQAMIEELKTDMRWNNGVLIDNFKPGKDAFVRRYGLPIFTRVIYNPTPDDIKRALEQGGAVEVSTGMTNSRSGQPNTGHVLTGVGIAADGGTLALSVHDPATPQGADVYELVPPDDRNNVMRIKGYPFWDGVVFIDAIFVQTWGSPSGNDSGTNTNQGTSKGTTGTATGITIETLLIGSNHFPLSQFHIGNNPQDACSEPHYHADDAVQSLEGTSLRDPAPSTCGFGTVKQIKKVTSQVTSEEAARWLIE